MNLDEFISETIKAITKGVKDSQQFVRDSGGRLNPIRMQNRSDLSGRDNVFYGSEENARPLTLIEFDIAVTVSNQNESGVNGGITVLGINVGGKDASANSNQTVSRIKFTIGASLPHELT